MKTTKHIQSLASKIASQEAKSERYPASEDHIAQTLQNVKEALLKGRFYVRVEKVSSSGMSRTMQLAYIKDNQLHHINYNWLLPLAGCDKRGRMSGCGFCALHETQYRLWCELVPSIPYQKMPRYNCL